ncbi:MAG: hypothetical protein H0T84_02160 [Tatlockia sp.]|nr:hypothetical protein [Tatlockia sp.]
MRKIIGTIISGAYTTVDKNTREINIGIKFRGPVEAATFYSFVNFKSLDVSINNNSICFPAISQNIPILQEIISTLIENIDGKKAGRETWFHNDTIRKIEKLSSIASWLSKQETLDWPAQQALIAPIRDVCAIKRNTWGLFQPHSLSEFNDLLKENELQVPNSIPLKGLEGSNGSRIINNVLAQIDSPNNSNLSATSIDYI